MITPTKLYKKFGAKVKKFREELGLSQVELAAKIDVEPATVSRIESGKAYASSTVLCKLCNVFNIKPVEIFNFNGIYIEDDSQKEKIENIANSLESFSDSQLNFINSIIELMKNGSFNNK